MSTLYCPECGYKNEYTIKPPNFCGGCGISLDGSTSPKGKAGKKTNKKPAKRKMKKPDFMTDASEDETDIEYVPEIGDLNVDIDYEGQTKVFKVEDLFTDEENLGNRSSS